MNSMIVTIDGPAGVGKSTVAKMLASRLDAVFLDTGATYRAVTLAAMNAGIDLNDAQAVLALMARTRFEFVHADNILKVTIDGIDATADIRRVDVTENVKHIASQGALRAELVKLQRAFASQFEKIVTEGRDQGTVVFPEPQFKFFLTADAEERARRRHEELKAGGTEMAFDVLVEQIVQRDASDENRAVGPLKCAPGAVTIDTTQLDAEGVVEKMLAVIEAAHG